MGNEVGHIAGAGLHEVWLKSMTQDGGVKLTFGWLVLEPKPVPSILSVSVSPPLQAGVQETLLITTCGETVAESVLHILGLTVRQAWIVIAVSVVIAAGV